MQTPTMGEIGGANLYSQTAAPYAGITGSTGEIGANMGFTPSVTSSMPAMPDYQSAAPLMQNTPVAQGGMKMGVPTQADMDMVKGKGFGIDNLAGAQSLLGMGGSQAQGGPGGDGAGVSKGQAPDANAVSSLLAAIRMPEDPQMMNLFWR